LVPYNTSHSLKVVRETFTDDGYAGRDCFDRSSLSPTVEVDIDYDVEKVEIRMIQSDGGSGDDLAILEMKLRANKPIFINSSGLFEELIV
jgi:hypothetical protein